MRECDDPNCRCHDESPDPQEGIGLLLLAFVVVFGLGAVVGFFMLVGR